jgi:hypothetical protein
MRTTSPFGLTPAVAFSAYEMDIPSLAFADTFSLGAVLILGFYQTEVNCH